MLFFKYFISLREMFTSKKSPMRRQWRRMDRFEDRMFAFIYQHFLTLGICSPQQKHQSWLLVGELLDDCIRELLPTDILMGICLIFSHRKTGIKQKDTLLRPFREISGLRNGNSEVRFYFFEDILEWRWVSYSFLDRKTEAMCLTYPMIGILSKYDYFHRIKRSLVESIEDIWSFRKNNLSIIPFLRQKFFDLRKIRLLEFILEHFLPGLVYLYWVDIYWHTPYIMILKNKINT